MNEETNTLIARWYLAQKHLGDVIAEEFSDWAVALLERNFDSKNVCILAALQNPASFYEIEDYFKRSLKEMGWEFPPEEVCLFHYAKDTANNILAEKIKPIDGCYQIYKISRALNHPVELSAWIFLKKGLEPENYRELIDWEIEEFSNLELDTAIFWEARKLINNLQNE